MTYKNRGSCRATLVDYKQTEDIIEDVVLEEFEDYVNQEFIDTIDENTIIPMFTYIENDDPGFKFIGLATNLHLDEEEEKWKCDITFKLDFAIPRILGYIIFTDKDGKELPSIILETEYISTMNIFNFKRKMFTIH